LKAEGHDRINVQNNPIQFIDPDGKEPVTIAAVTTYAAYTAATALAAGIVYYGRPIAEDVGTWIGNWLWNESAEEEISGDNSPCDSKRHSPDQEALKDLIDEETLGGRKPLSNEDADAILDWADEVGINGARDDRGKDHWEGGDHIHVPGSGIGHIPVQ